MVEESKTFIVGDPAAPGQTYEIPVASLKDLQEQVALAFRQPGFLRFKRPGSEGVHVMVTSQIKFEDLPNRLEWMHQPQGAASIGGEAGAGAGAGAVADAEATYHNIVFVFEDEQGEPRSFIFIREIKRSKLIAFLQERGLFAIYNPDEQLDNEESVRDPCRLEDAELKDNTTYYAVLKGSTQTFGAFVRSLVDADEHQMSERLRKHLQKYNPQAFRICQKHFWSRDKKIKFECDVLVVDGDKIYFGEGKTRLGPSALTDLDIKMAKIE